MISAVDCGSRPIMGSSSTHSLGSWMSAAMMQIFCFMPWEYALICLSMAKRSLKRSRYLSSLSVLSALDTR